MKTFICALAVVCILTGAVVLNMLSINRSVDEMLDIASSVPGHDGDIADDFSDVAEKVEKLWELWDKKITKLAYTVLRLKRTHPPCGRDHLGRFFVAPL